MFLSPKTSGAKIYISAYRVIIDRFQAKIAVVDGLEPEYGRVFCG
jgi:hypothetical protein